MAPAHAGGEEEQCRINASWVRAASRSRERTCSLRGSSRATEATHRHGRAGPSCSLLPFRTINPSKKKKIRLLEPFLSSCSESNVGTERNLPRIKRSSFFYFLILFIFLFYSKSNVDIIRRIRMEFLKYREDGFIDRQSAKDESREGSGFRSLGRSDFFYLFFF